MRDKSKRELHAYKFILNRKPENLGISKLAMEQPCLYLLKVFWVGTNKPGYVGELFTKIKRLIEIFNLRERLTVDILNLIFDQKKFYVLNRIYLFLLWIKLPSL